MVCNNFAAIARLNITTTTILHAELQISRCPILVSAMTVLLSASTFATFCSTHNEHYEEMGENQETTVQTFMDTSLQYLQGTAKHGLYSLVIHCLEVRLSVYCIIIIIINLHGFGVYCIQQIFAGCIFHECPIPDHLCGFNFAKP